MTRPTSPAMQEAAHNLPVDVFPHDDSRIIESDAPDPFDLRLIDWTTRQIVQPRRIVRFLYWGFAGITKRYERVREFVAVQLSPKVESGAYEERQNICGECESQKMVKGVTWFGRAFVHLYCGACNCGQWWLAELREHKNWKARHRCPRRKHPGTYPKRLCAGCGANGDRSHGNA